MFEWFQAEKSKTLGTPADLKLKFQGTQKLRAQLDQRNYRNLIGHFSSNQIDAARYLDPRHILVWCCKEKKISNILLFQTQRNRRGTHLGVSERRGFSCSLLRRSRILVHNSGSSRSILLKKPLANFCIEKKHNINWGRQFGFSPCVL